MKDDRQRIRAYHEGVDLGGPAMARIATDYGYTRAELRKLSDGDHMSTWHYRVPALRINGGGTATREGAQRECLDAIAFALEATRASTTATLRRSPWRCLSLLPPDLRRLRIGYCSGST